MKNIVLIDASPKINERSVSKLLINKAAKHFNDDNVKKTYINIRQSYKKNEIPENYKTIINADAVIIAFPLYIFCIPGILMRFLQDYHQFYLENKNTAGSTKIYAMVNCGFPEPEINLEAVNVIKSFSRQINAHFRFGILIGCGGMLVGGEGKPVIKKAEQKLSNALSVMAKDSLDNNFDKIENVAIKTISFPAGIFLFIMNKFGWASTAKKNGLKRKDLYRKPYLIN